MAGREKSFSGPKIVHFLTPKRLTLCWHCSGHLMRKQIKTKTFLSNLNFHSIALILLLIFTNQFSKVPVCKHNTDCKKKYILLADHHPKSLSCIARWGSFLPCSHNSGPTPLQFSPEKKNSNSTFLPIFSKPINMVYANTSKNDLIF